MPNHCSNALIVLGEPDEVTKFVAGARVASETEDHLPEYDRAKYAILKSYYPCPEELNVSADGTKRPDLFAKYGAHDWYEWCNAKWGTKWGDYDTYLSEHKPGVALFHFTTAWAPGVDGFTKISADNPSLVFVNSYSEPGMGFYGCVAISEGQLITDVGGQHSDAVEGVEKSSDEWYEAIDELQQKEIEHMTHLVVCGLADKWRKLLEEVLP